jgi:hypothetical protein
MVFEPGFENVSDGSFQELRKRNLVFDKPEIEGIIDTFSDLLRINLHYLFLSLSFLMNNIANSLKSQERRCMSLF